ncbi:phage holin [Psychrobacillus psychrodurans]|uniref:phage holin n=1 Tax=Psychrobacillus psychrodurans TaxID=126157 RepID=UPI003D029489
MNINWKVRFKNRLFYAALVLAIVAPIGVSFGVNLEDLTTWQRVWDIAKKAILTPHLVITVFIAVVTSLIDPTTKGLNDSPRAMKYKEPKTKISCHLAAFYFEGGDCYVNLTSFTVFAIHARGKRPWNGNQFFALSHLIL